MDFLNELRWRPTIGDPGFMGWFTVAAYAAAAILAARAWWLGQGRVWLLVAIGMFALCINKQLDLQSLVTDIGRVAAWHEGWYQKRREYQKWFVIGTAAVCGITGLFVVIRYHKFWMHHKLLAAGGIFLITFIAVRMISFHHFDSFLKTSMMGMKMNWVLELTGISLVAAAAFKELKGKPGPPRSVGIPVRR